MVWFSPAQKPTPDRSNRGMYGCVCVRAMKCQIFRPLRAISVAKNYSYNLPIIWVFFLLLGYIILWGSHIKLVCDNFEFYFLRLGNLKLMLLRSFFFSFASRIFCFVLFQCPYVYVSIHLIILASTDFGKRNWLCLSFLFNTMRDHLAYFASVMCLCLC